MIRACPGGSGVGGLPRGERDRQDQRWAGPPIRDTMRAPSTLKSAIDHRVASGRP